MSGSQGKNTMGFMRLMSETTRSPRGVLAGLDSKKLSTPALEPPPHNLTLQLTSFRDNYLLTEITELSGRLTRLEGLMLELSSQIVPAFAKILSSPLNREAQPISEAREALVHPESDSPAAPPTEETLQAPAKQPPTFNRWWPRRLVFLVTQGLDLRGNS
jgi:hypothetical protein